MAGHAHCPRVRHLEDSLLVRGDEAKAGCQPSGVELPSGVER